MSYGAIARHGIFHVKLHHQQHFIDVADQQTGMPNTMSIKLPRILQICPWHRCPDAAQAFWACRRADEELPPLPPLLPIWTPRLKVRWPGASWNAAVGASMPESGAVQRSSRVAACGCRLLALKSPLEDLHIFAGYCLMGRYAARLQRSVPVLHL
ncbi:uncharacterized protein TrAtP1_004685 [Trichoderma atroviride]|uniref:uncharacterized protein n=1 Tax=Hypocrea atroviridis TaxID=63577 RepID=UPI00332C29D7|nr:hypothetical protein TrAtP1_004685 [Trichoderma atroviride]